MTTPDGPARVIGHEILARQLLVETDDRRRKLVSLTPHGQDAIAAAEAILYRPPEAISTLTNQELEHLVERS